MDIVTVIEAATYLQQNKQELDWDCLVVKQ